jgi:hypothetical protein
LLAHPSGVNWKKAPICLAEHSDKWRQPPPRLGCGRHFDLRVDVV